MGVEQIVMKFVQYSQSICSFDQGFLLKLDAAHAGSKGTDWKSRSALRRFQGYASGWKWNYFRLAARPHGIVLDKGQ